MRLVTFTLKEDTHAVRTPRVGALLAGGEQILDFNAALLSNSAPSGYVPPAALLTWFDMDNELWTRSRELYMQVDRAMERQIGPWYGSEAIHERTDAELLAPVPRPGKLICIGLNYRDHAAESNMPIPSSPIIFSKFPTAVTGPGQPVVLPEASTQVDYEAELAVVIGRRAKKVAATQALDYVLGYTNLNDVSARDLQFADGQWQRGKSCDTFAPMGPYIATKDDIPDPHNLPIRLRLNDQTMQDSTTNQLIFSVPQLIEFLTQTITL